MPDKPQYIDLLPISIDVYEYEERAGIIEHDAKFDVLESEKRAYEEMKLKYNF